MSFLNSDKISHDFENKVLNKEYFIKKIKGESGFMRPFYSGIQPHLVDPVYKHRLQSFCKIRC